MNPSITELNAETLYARLLTQIREALADKPKVAIVGIRSGGAWIAERIVSDLGLENPPGFIDVSFYRDDYAEKGLPAEVKPTQIPFDVEGATILLIDDVLYTGRTTRAAINELFDYGRPACIFSGSPDRQGWTGTAHCRRFRRGRRLAGQKRETGPEPD